MNRIRYTVAEINTFVIMLIISSVFLMNWSTRTHYSIPIYIWLYPRCLDWAFGCSAVITFLNGLFSKKKEDSSIFVTCRALIGFSIFFWIYCSLLYQLFHRLLYIMVMNSLAIKVIHQWGYLFSNLYFWQIYSSYKITLYDWLY